MLRYVSIVFFCIVVNLTSIATANELEAVDIYSQKQLAELIRSDTYLQQVLDDDCQLVLDIEAHAEILKEPLYQFLWGEMLNSGTCVSANKKRGMALIETSARQGLTEALYRLARYFYEGELVIENKEKAIDYVLPAAYGGYVPAQFMLVQLFVEGYGSPVDYEMGYQLLYRNAFDDQMMKEKAEHLLQQLAPKMSRAAVKRAEQEY